MTANKLALAGSFSFGDLDLERAWRDLAPDFGALRASAAPRQGEHPQLSQPSPFAAFHSDAESQLYRYLENVRAASKAPRPSPIDTLARRLEEFEAQREIGEQSPEPSHEEDSAERAPSEKGESAAQEASQKLNASYLEWFDGKFAELRTLVTSRQSESSELVSINARLAEIIERVDNLSQLLPSEPAIESIEKQLQNLAATLDSMRSEQNTQADEVRQAASAVSDAAVRLDQSRDAMEEAADSAMDRIAQASAASQAQSSITAEQIAEALRRALPVDNLTRVEDELRSLNAQSRESNGRTAETLERVHETLREFLQKVDQPDQPAARMIHPLKRLGVHMPITAGAPAFARSPKDFGAASSGGSAGRLETLVSRNERYLPPAESRALATRTGLDVDDPSRPVSPIPAFLRSTRAFEDDARPALPRQRETSSPSPAHTQRSISPLGVGIVALILIMASAALLYLHMTSSSPMPGSPGAAAYFGRGNTSSAASSKQAKARPAARIFREGSDSADDGAALPTAVGTGLPFHMLQATAPAPAPAQTWSWQAIPVSSNSGSVSFVSAGPADTITDDVQSLAAAASQGDSEAQYQIGRRFLADNSIRSNRAAAARWLGRAAEKGHMEAQYLLGTLFEDGIGMAKDDAQALDWYRRAAEAGHVKAMHNLGVLHTGQHNVGVNYHQAFYWFSQAAKHGVADSQFNLAILYENGLGVERDERLAYFWYSVSALGGDHGASAQSQRLRRSLSREEAAQTDAEAGAWKPVTFVQRNEASRAGLARRG